MVVNPAIYFFPIFIVINNLPLFDIEIYIGGVVIAIDIHELLVRLVVKNRGETIVPQARLSWDRVIILDDVPVLELEAGLVLLIHGFLGGLGPGEKLFIIPRCSGSLQGSVIGAEHIGEPVDLLIIQHPLPAWSIERKPGSVNSLVGTVLINKGQVLPVYRFD